VHINDDPQVLGTHGVKGFRSLQDRVKMCSLYALEEMEGSLWSQLLNNTHFIVSNSSQDLHTWKKVCVCLQTQEHGSHQMGQPIDHKGFRRILL